jgi:hypothetical protein
VDEHCEAIFGAGEGDEGRDAAGIFSGQETGQLAAQHPARSRLVSTLLDDVEYLVEHGTLSRLPRGHHRCGTAESGSHAIASTYPAAVVIQAGHGHRPP